MLLKNKNLGNLRVSRLKNNRNDIETKVLLIKKEY